MSSCVVPGCPSRVHLAGRCLSHYRAARDAMWATGPLHGRCPRCGLDPVPLTPVPGGGLVRFACDGCR